jgi:ketosteroid isomerase-like protein
VSAADKQVVADFVHALEGGDRDRIAALLTPDATWWLPGRLPVSGTYAGRDAILDDFLAHGLALYRPATLTFEIVRMVAEAGTVAVEWVADGISAGGETYRNHYHVAFDVRDGRIAAVREYVDTLYVLDVLFPAG